MSSGNPGSPPEASEECALWRQTAGKAFAGSSQVRLFPPQQPIRAHTSTTAPWAEPEEKPALFVPAFGRPAAVPRVVLMHGTTLGQYLASRAAR